MKPQRILLPLLATLLLSDATTRGQSAALPSSTPDPKEPQPRAIAVNAVNDLLGHFWLGDERTGHILNTHDGYSNESLRNGRGVLWERGMFYLVLENLQRLSPSAALQQRLRADWNYTKRVNSPAELQACGEGSGNVAVDDAGWAALMYLAAYRATGDKEALDRARGLVNNSFSRWQDAKDGGIWYSDRKDKKSLYQAAIVLAAIQIHELAPNPGLFDRATRSYVWMENHLLRDDGLYWCDYGASAPIGQSRSNRISETSSVVFLGGNMGMGVLHAHFYRLTTEDTYRVRALRTATALSRRLATAENVFINDRDASTEGVFAGDWAREVLSLPGIAARDKALLRNTAVSIYTKARTASGYYGASWSGPAEGDQSRWWRTGRKPDRITISSSSVNMIVAAAFLEAK